MHQTLNDRDPYQVDGPYPVGEPNKNPTGSDIDRYLDNICSVTQIGISWILIELYPLSQATRGKERPVSPEE
jgi:hypothetical protein